MYTAFQGFLFAGMQQRVPLTSAPMASDMGKMEEELGCAIATVADECNGYLAGVDILCDGVSKRGQKEFKKKK